MEYFEKEVLSFVKNSDSDVCKFIINHWSGQYARFGFNHYFQEVFLYKTGAISVNTRPILDTKNGWAPTINFSKDNLYREAFGYKLLTQNPLTQKQAEIRIAKYFIEILNFMPLDKVKIYLKK
jgi:hypothetical protein